SISSSSTFPRRLRAPYTRALGGGVPLCEKFRVPITGAPLQKQVVGHMRSQSNQQRQRPRVGKLRHVRQQAGFVGVEGDGIGRRSAHDYRKWIHLRVSPTRKPSSIIWSYDFVTDFMISPLS